MQTAVRRVSRELTKAGGPWDIGVVSDDDGECFCFVLLVSDGIRFVREASVYYLSVGTMSLNYVSRSNSKLEAPWRSMQLHIHYLRSLEDSERVRAAFIKSLQNCLVVLYEIRLDIIEQMHQLVKDLGGAWMFQACLGITRGSKHFLAAAVRSVLNYSSQTSSGRC